MLNQFGVVFGFGCTGMHLAASSILKPVGSFQGPAPSGREFSVLYSRLSSSSSFPSVLVRENRRTLHTHTHTHTYNALLHSLQTHNTHTGDNDFARLDFP